MVVVFSVTGIVKSLTLLRGQCVGYTKGGLTSLSNLRNLTSKHPLMDLTFKLKIGLSSSEGFFFLSEDCQDIAWKWCHDSALHISYFGPRLYYKVFGSGFLLLTNRTAQFWSFCVVSNPSVNPTLIINYFGTTLLMTFHVMYTICKGYELEA